MGNAEATRERILEAAMEEFSSYGIAGARVDRIAKKAECNKNMIYVYFDNKETLFITVLQNNLKRVYEEVTFTPKDLPGYAVKVFDYAMANPELFRLMAWYGLEKNNIGLTEDKLEKQMKIYEVMNAQSSGLVGTTFTPGFLLTAIMILGTAWAPANPFGPSFDPDAVKKPKETRDAIFKAVSLMTKV